MTGRYSCLANDNPNVMTVSLYLLIIVISLFMIAIVCTILWFIVNCCVAIVAEIIRLQLITPKQLVYKAIIWIDKTIIKRIVKLVVKKIIQKFYERNDLVNTKELLNTKIKLNPVIQNVSVGDTGENPFVATILETTANKDNPFEWNVLMDIVVPDGTDVTSLS